MRDVDTLRAAIVAAVVAVPPDAAGHRAVAELLTVAFTVERTGAVAARDEVRRICRRLLTETVEHAATAPDGRDDGTPPPVSRASTCP